MDITIAPVKGQTKPDKIQPPITPINFINLGTGAPFPKRIVSKRYRTSLPKATMPSIQLWVPFLFTANK